MVSQDKTEEFYQRWSHREREFSIERLTENVTLLGGPYAYLYWVLGSRAALIDAGTVIWGRKLITVIPEYLDLEEFAYHLLTHSHYDHLGGTPEILDAFPDIKVFAHPHISRVLKSPRALKHIEEMNRKELRMWGRREETIRKYRFKAFKIHQHIQEGNTIDLGNGVKIVPIETPGHTRDSVSYFIEPDGVLVTGEAVGVPNVEETFILPQFVSDAEAYLNSLEKISRIHGIKVLGLPHEHLIIGSERVREFLRFSIECTRMYISDIAALIRKHGSDGRVIEDEIVKRYYIPYKLRQPIFAFLANLRYQIRAVRRML